jgi:hypothetical protein
MSKSADKDKDKGAGAGAGAGAGKGKGKDKDSDEDEVRPRKRGRGRPPAPQAPAPPVDFRVRDRVLMKTFAEGEEKVDRNVIGYVIATITRIVMDENGTVYDVVLCGGEEYTDVSEHHITKSVRM